jgi:hypothetical protein
VLALIVDYDVGPTELHLSMVSDLESSSSRSRCSDTNCVSFMGCWVLGRPQELTLKRSGQSPTACQSWFVTGHGTGQVFPSCSPQKSLNDEGDRYLEGPDLQPPVSASSDSSQVLLHCTDLERMDLFSPWSSHTKPTRSPPAPVRLPVLDH